MQEINRDIFCGNGKRVLYIIVAVIGLLSVQCIKSYAADEKLKQNLSGTTVESEGVEFNAILYDKFGRKILIKDGTSWGVDEDIIIKIPIEGISEKEGKVVITYTITDEEYPEVFAFKCFRK